jgi:UDP-N-acetylmuramate dehydrogenase
MTFPDIVPELKTKMPELRGRLLANQPLGEFTWFRAGGPAQVFFMPEDDNDLAYFLRNLPEEIAITAIGAGSNLIVRDGGVPGVVIRLGRGFNEAKIEDQRVTVGSAMLDVMVAKSAHMAVKPRTFLLRRAASTGKATCVLSAMVKWAFRTATAAHRKM